MKARHKNYQSFNLLTQAEKFVAPSRSVPQLTEAQIAFHGGLGKTATFSMENHKLLTRSKKTPSIT